MTDISSDDLQRIICAMEASLDKRRSVTEDDHHIHHEWITLQIARDKRRALRWEKVSQTVIGWAIIGALSGIGVAVYRVFIKG